MPSNEQPHDDYTYDDDDTPIEPDYWLADNPHTGVQDHETSPEAKAHATAVDEQRDKGPTSE